MFDFRLARIVVWLLVSGGLAPLAIITCLASGLGIFDGILVSGVVLGLVWLAVSVWVPARLGSSGRGAQVLLGAATLVGLLAGLRIAATSTFMLDPADTRFAVYGEKKWAIRHNCFTGYLVAAELASGGAENIYERSQYRGSAKKTRIHATIGDRFTIDRYPYPPAFLILPRLLLATGQGFLEIRTFWFALSAAMLILALLATMTWCGGFRDNRRLLFLPLLLLAPTTAVALQIENVQLILLSLCVLGMIAFARERPALGGALLGFAILIKLWPGVLLVHLLLGRRWRAVLWTVGAMVAYCLAALLIFGQAPFRAFLDYELPRLASGESFAFMQSNSRALVVNTSLFGVLHKLHALGYLLSKPPLLSPLIQWNYTTLLVVIVLAVGLRQRVARGPSDGGDQLRLGEVRTWLALLTLVQLRSPFLPWSYGVLSALWLLLLFLPSRAWPIVLPAAAWLSVSLLLPRAVEPTALYLWYTMGGTGLMLATALLAAVLALRAPAARAGGEAGAAR
ncbi:MAG: glycosyltransferase family 87 protein [Planctomycetota bacterium]